MKHVVVRTLMAFCVVAVLGSVAFHLVAGPVCLSARSVSGCQRCCQPAGSSETQGQVPACSVFCCAGLPRALDVPVRRVLSLTVFLPRIRDLSVCLAPAPPPPKPSLSIQG